MVITAWVKYTANKTKTLQTDLISSFICHKNIFIETKRKKIKRVNKKNRKSNNLYTVLSIFKYIFLDLYLHIYFIRVFFFQYWYMCCRQKKTWSFPYLSYLDISIDSWIRTRYHFCFSFCWLLFFKYLFIISKGFVSKQTHIIVFMNISKFCMNWIINSFLSLKPF